MLPVVISVIVIAKRGRIAVPVVWFGMRDIVEAAAADVLGTEAFAHLAVVLRLQLVINTIRTERRPAVTGWIVIAHDAGHDFTITGVKAGAQETVANNLDAICKKYPDRPLVLMAAAGGFKTIGDDAKAQKISKDVEILENPSASQRQDAK